MKVKISKYPTKKRCTLFGDYMTDKYGYVDWPLEFSLYEKLLNNLEQCVDWIYDHTVNLFFNHGNQKVHVRIDPWDTWSMDCTLAHIILPMLKQLRDIKHGAAFVDYEDTPEDLWPNAAEIKAYELDGSTDIHFCARWDWILDEMIWAFEQKLCDDWEGEYYGPWIKAEEDEFIGGFEWVDEEGRKKHEDRMKNGFRLFGKYYEALWD